MKRLTILTFVMLSSCVSTNLPDCNVDYENLGYAYVDFVLDSSNYGIKSRGLSQGCDIGDLLQFSNKNLYKCTDSIYPNFSDKVVLMEQDIELFYKKGGQSGCFGDIQANQCNSIFNVFKSDLIAKGFKEPFVLQYGYSRSTHYRLITSDEQSFSLTYFGSITDQGLSNNKSTLLSKSYAEGCFFQDSAGKDLSYSDIAKYDTFIKLREAELLH